MFWLVDSAGARITDQVELFPGSARRGADLPQPGGAVRQGAAGLLPVRAVRGRRGVHPGVLRRRVHGRGQRQHVPGQPADGRDGGRRDGDAGGDGRCPDALHRLRLRGQPRRRRRRRHRAGPALLLLPADLLAGGSAGVPGRAAGAGVHPGPGAGARSRCRSTSTRSIEALVDAGSFFEVKPLFAAELVVGFARLDGPPVGVLANNSAVRGGVLFSDSADKAARFIWLCDALQRAAGLPRRRARVHDRQRGGAAGDHPARREDDHGGGRGDRAAGVRGPAQGLRRRAVRDGRARLRPGRDAGAADRADRRDGSGGGRERRVRQQDRGDRGRAPSARRSSPTRRVEYEEDVDLLRLAGDLVVDAVVEPGELRRELVLRLAYAVGRDRRFSDRRHGVPPV